MPRLRPRANSPAGKSFRELRDRFLAGRDEPSPLRRELAERAAWARVGLDPLDQKLAAGRALGRGGTALRELDPLAGHGAARDARLRSASGAGAATRCRAEAVA